MLLPEPFGPMMACTSPAFTVRSMPFRISRSPTVACRFLISSSGMYVLTNASFETDTEQLLRLDGELHREFLEDFLAEAVDDHRDRVFGGDAALPAVENLVLADLRGGRLVLDASRRCSSLRDTGTCARRTCRPAACESHCE